MRCRKCGAEVSPGQSFCGKCGARILSKSQTPERKPEIHQQPRKKQSSDDSYIPKYARQEECPWTNYPMNNDPKATQSAQKPKKKRGCLTVLLWIVGVWFGLSLLLGSCGIIVGMILPEEETSQTETTLLETVPTATNSIENMETVQKTTLIVTEAAQVEETVYQEQLQTEDIAKEYPEPDELPDESPNPDRPSFVFRQKQYAADHGIQLVDFDSQLEKVMDWFLGYQGKSYFVEIDNLFGADQFKRTSDHDSRYIYMGSMEDNYPQGYGCLLERVDRSYGITEINGDFYNYVYVGMFEKGYFDGFGILFHDSDPEETKLEEYFYIDSEHDLLMHYCPMWENYVEYYGGFHNGEPNGKGNAFRASSLYYLESRDVLNQISYTEIATGEFQDSKLNGEGKLYQMGKLYYEGGLRKNKMHGFGKRYYLPSGILEYEGKFKNGYRHGEGTSYFEDGSVDYSGKWENDDLA